MSEIDPIAYGVLTAKVEAMEKKIDKLEHSIDQLLALANQSKGGLWIGMAIISAISSVMGFISHHFIRG